MSEALEGKKDVADPDTRVLYVPQGISYEAQLYHGYELLGMGYTVWIHDHSYLVQCTRGLDGSNGRCGQLTIPAEPATLDTIS